MDEPKDNLILTPKQRRFVEEYLIDLNAKLSEPTDIAEILYSVGVDLLDEVDRPGPFRLVGMVAYDLAPAKR